MALKTYLTSPLRDHSCITPVTVIRATQAPSALTEACGTSVDPVQSESGLWVESNID